jgi:parvulin-like peptidyl-prolyl isomerase
MSALSTRVASCLLGLLLSLSAVSPVGAQTRDGAPPKDNGAVMRINGVDVPAEEFGRWLLDIEGERLSHTFGEQWLVRREAAKEGVSVAPEQVGQELDQEIAIRVHGAFLDKRDDWLAELQRLGRSEGGHRAQRTAELEPQMLTTEMCRRGRVVPEEKIRRDWELFYGPGGREYELRGIKFLVEVVTPDKNAPQGEYEQNRRRAFGTQLARALDCRERLNNGADFATLARELSDDAPSRDQGGKINAKFRRPGWTDEFVAMLAGMQPGAISQPMYAKGGYWIMQLVSVVTTPYEKVRDQLEQRLIDLGPEQDETGAVWNRIVKGMDLELLPTLYQEGALTPETTEPVMGMTINGTPVPRAEFALWLLHSRGEADASFFTEHWLVQRKAESLGISITPQEVEARVNAFVERMLGESYSGDREQWIAYLRKHGRDQEGFLRQLRRRQYVDGLVEKIVVAQRQITEDDIHRRWAQLYGASGRWIEARVILVDFKPPEVEAGLTREEFEQRIHDAHETLRASVGKLRERLDNGEDFATLARQFNSDATLRANAGKLEGRFRPDAWPQEVAEAVMALEPGHLAGPLDTGKAFAIFEVLSARPVPFAEVHDQLADELKNERILDSDLAVYRNVLLKQAKFEVLPAMYR